MLQTELERLEHADLVRRAKIAPVPRPDPEYWFKHGLVQETTYESLLKQDRRRLHRFVAQVLETVAGVSDDETAPLLAKHWDEAGEANRAFNYYMQAGDSFARVYANAEALMAYNRALELSQSIDLLPEPLQHLYLQRGRTFELDAQDAQALANYHALGELAQTRRDDTLALAALLAQIPIYSTPSNFFNTTRASDLVEQALTLARSLHDRPSEAKTLWLRMLLMAHLNHPERAVADGEAALALARELNLRELTAYTLNDLGGVYVSLGDFARGNAMVADANVLWRELGNQPLLANNLSSAANFLLYSGDYDTVIRLSDEAYQISEHIGNLWGQSYSLFSVGLAHLEQGEFARGMASMEKCLFFADKAGFVAPHLDTQLQLATAYAWLGDAPRAIELGLKTRQDTDTFPAGYSPCYAALAEFYIEANDIPQAETALRQAWDTLKPKQNPLVNQLVVNRAALIVTVGKQEWRTVLEMVERMLPEMAKFNVKLFLPDIWLYRARAHASLGNLDNALESIHQADTIAQQIGSKRIRWQILAQRAALEGEEGNLQAADQFRTEARELVTFIAKNAPPELRETFLNRADVRAIMAE